MRPSPFSPDSLKGPREYRAIVIKGAGESTHSGFPPPVSHSLSKYYCNVCGIERERLFTEIGGNALYVPSLLHMKNRGRFFFTFFRSSNKGGGGVFAKTIEFETVATAAKFPTGTTYYLGYWELYFAVLFGHCMLPCFSLIFLVSGVQKMSCYRAEAVLFLPLQSPTTVLREAP